MATRIQLLTPLPLFGGAPQFNERIIRKGKKRRLISEPNDAMRELHRKLIEELELLIAGFHNAAGGLKGGSGIENAIKHRYSRYFYQTDIRDAFPSTPIKRLAQELHYLDPKFGSPEEIRMFLRRYCCNSRGELATGGPASMLLFNIYCTLTIDRPLADLVRSSEGSVCTRYVDDITISSNKPIMNGLRKRVRQVIADAGFEISRHKTTLLDVRGARPVIVTGVVIKRNHLIEPTEEFFGKLESLLRLNPKEASEQDLLKLHGCLAYLDSFSDFDENGREIATRRTQQTQQQCREFLRHAPRTRDRRPYNHWIQVSGYPKGFLDSMRRTIPIHEVVGKKVTLRKKREHVGLCPFHREKTPSFKVSAEKGFYHCFGCGAHGDVFAFLMRVSDVTFPEAVRMLAKEYNIRLPKRIPIEKYR